MKRSAIVETMGGGHRLVYLRLLVEGAATCGLLPLLFVSRDVRESPGYQLQLESVVDPARVVEIPTGSTLRDVARRARQHGCERIVVPDGDRLAWRVGLGARIPAGVDLAVLIMRDPEWVRDAEGSLPLRQHVKRRVLKRAERRARTNVLWLREPGYRGRAGELYVNDPITITDVQSVRDVAGPRFRNSVLGSEERFWFGLVGGMSTRKNVPLVVRAVSRVSRESDQQIGLALFGPWGTDLEFTPDDLKQALERTGVELRVVDRLFEDHELNAAVAAIDCVVMAYSSHSPNGTLGKAAALGIRLVAVGPPSVQRFVTSVHGAPTGPLNEDTVVELMLRSTMEPAPTPRDFTEDRFADPLLGL